MFGCVCVRMMYACTHVPTQQGMSVCVIAFEQRIDRACFSVGRKTSIVAPRPGCPERGIHIVSTTHPQRLYNRQWSAHIIGLTRGQKANMQHAPDFVGDRVLLSVCMSCLYVCTRVL